MERRDGVPGEPLEERQWHDNGPETVPTEPQSCNKMGFSLSKGPRCREWRLTPALVIL